MTRSAQVTYLMRRFGLTFIQARLIAGLHYGEAPQ